MSGSWMRARADVRARPVSLIAVTILVGVIGAIAIAAFAGARQTDSAYERYRTTSHEPRPSCWSCPNGFASAPIDLEGRNPVERGRFGDRRVRTSEHPGAGRLAPAVQHPDFSSTVIALRDPSDASVVQPQMLAGRPPAGPTRSRSATRIRLEAGGRVRDRRHRRVGDALAEGRRQGASSSGTLAGVVQIPVRVTGWVLGLGRRRVTSPASGQGPGSSTRGGDEAWMCEAGVFQLQGDFASLTPFLASIYTMEPKAFVLNMTVERVRGAIDASDRRSSCASSPCSPPSQASWCWDSSSFGARRSARSTRRCCGGRDDPLADRVGRRPACGRRLRASARDRGRGAIALSPLFPWACRERSIRPSACGSTGSRSCSAWSCDRPHDDPERRDPGSAARVGADRPGAVEYQRIGAALGAGA